jgi:hypothetical protein
MQIDGAFAMPKGWCKLIKHYNPYHYCPDCWIRNEDGKAIIRKTVSNPANIFTEKVVKNLNQGA